MHVLENKLITWLIYNMQMIWTQCSDLVSIHCLEQSSWFCFLYMTLSNTNPRYHSYSNTFMGIYGLKKFSYRETC